jgi:hypothetical protein
VRRAAGAIYDAQVPRYGAVRPAAPPPPPPPRRLACCYSLLINCWAATCARRRASSSSAVPRWRAPAHHSRRLFLRRGSALLLACVVMVTAPPAAVAAVVLPAILLVLLCTAFVEGTPGNPVRPDYRWANPQAVEKWHDMKVRKHRHHSAPCYQCIIAPFLITAQLLHARRLHAGR